LHSFLGNFKPCFNRLGNSISGNFEVPLRLLLENVRRLHGIFCAKKFLVSSEDKVECLISLLTPHPERVAISEHFKGLQDLEQGMRHLARKHIVALLKLSIKVDCAEIKLL